MRELIGWRSSKHRRCSRWLNKNIPIIWKFASSNDWIGPMIKTTWCIIWFQSARIFLWEKSAAIFLPSLFLSLTATCNIASMHYTFPNACDECALGRSLHFSSTPHFHSFHLAWQRVMQSYLSIHTKRAKGKKERVTLSQKPNIKGQKCECK